MTFKRIKLGDVLEIVTPTECVYVLYLGKHRTYGDAILVCPTPQAHVQPSAVLFERGYVTFYPAGSAVRQGLASIVGNLPAPKLPTRFRRYGALNGKRIETWIIENDPGITVRTELSLDERSLPIAAIWNHEFLVERVRNGWRPELEVTHIGGDEKDRMEGRTRMDRTETESASVKEGQRVAHYLYFPKEETASVVGKELSEQGFQINVRLGADGVNWLVLARHAPLLAELSINDARDQLRRIAEGFGGEYDGWEAVVESL